MAEGKQIEITGERIHQELYKSRPEVAIDDFWSIRSQIKHISDFHHAAPSRDPPSPPARDAPTVPRPLARVDRLFPDIV
jgi:hypothetical protein